LVVVFSGYIQVGCDSCALGARLASSTFLFLANEANVELLPKPFAAQRPQGLMAPSIHTIVTLASNEGRSNKGPELSSSSLSGARLSGDGALD
jgi:hypothetical protein